MQGLHLTADLYDCACDASIMIDAETLAALCRTHTLDVGLTLVGEKWHTFPEYQGEPGGVTGMLLLAESHLAIHTWPERNGVTLDVYVCNFEGDNSSKAERLMNELEAAFKPGRAQRNRLMRGEADGPGPEGELLLENLNDNSVYGFRFARRLLTRQTDYQYLELLESADMGKTLRLDGCLMTAETEEFFYHEALVHPAAMALDTPRSALIIGGGDGGALEELLKHPVENVTLVDLDEQVIQVSREHLQSINNGAFDDPRVTVRVGNGAEFVEQTDQRFDLVLLDLTDPETPAGPLYTEAFFQQCKAVLAPGGAIVLHLGTPFHEPAQVSGLAGALHNVFNHVSAYGLHIPLYGSYWALAVASDDLVPTALTAEQVRQRIDQRGIDDLQYYNEDVHGALFALPNYYRRLVQVEETVC
ncbi:MAG TPA: polyamine aminopropyltransferase [Burkholderiaceae bacterium]|nr:polyamine aminopropyltransferase [Burkholderiaceae bacterium]